jgi:hypothetical protein
MKPDENAQTLRLKKRESELQRLISQMKTDELDQSVVFKQLERELTELKTGLEGPSSSS